MSDVETLARRAGAAAREEARMRLAGTAVPAMPDRRRGGRVRAVGLVVTGLVTGIVVAALAVSANGPPTPVVEPASPPVLPAVTPDQPTARGGELPVPAVGEALAAYLDDGRPVFVSHPVESEVVVLDAEDPRAPWGSRQLVAYCSSSGWFEELRHGSRFNGWGQWTGGPSPAGLAVHPSELAPDGQTVRVTGPAGEHPERDPADQRDQSSRGPSCSDETDGRATGGPGVVQHLPPDSPSVTDGNDLPTDRWTWVRLLVGGSAAEAVVCDRDGTCPQDGPAIAGLEPSDPFVLLPDVRRTMLARATEHGAVEVVLPASDAEGPHPFFVPVEDRLLARPPAGEASASFLADGTPVWVVHEAGGEVRVVDGTSPDMPTSLLTWCPEESVLVDAGGRAYGPSNLAHYPSGLVDHADTVGVRVTGGGPVPGSGAASETAAGTTCRRGVGHAPPQLAMVAEGGRFVAGPHRWTWVDMEIRSQAGDLYLCASSRHGCVSGTDPEAAARCETLGTHADPEDCEPYRDPIVTTPGARPSDGRQLMLVRLASDGTVDVRIPLVAFTSN
ncbi:hypothetical protein [Egicoccus sp. AB-alg2]|uniref:hypothetical protein n=1 Tax=Egicoccus sp. AB-alg2 TaxID=3242693 RepID=UPI00359DE0F6